MTPIGPHILLFRIEAARRETQRQIDLIERQISHRMTGLTPISGRSKPAYRHGKPPEVISSLARYRSCLASLMAFRQPEIDALSQKLVPQDMAILALRERLRTTQTDRRNAA